MRFPLTFFRSKPVTAPNPVLGGDSLLTRKPAVTDDNVLFVRMVSVNGVALNRIVLHAKYTGSVTVPAALPVTAYVYDDAIGYWIQLPQSAVSVVPSTPNSTVPAATTPIYFDAMSLMDLQPTAAGLSNPQPGSGAAFLFLVSDPGAGAPNGVYQFIAGGGLSTKAF